MAYLLCFLSFSLKWFIKLKALMSAPTGLPALHCSPGSHFLNGLMGLSWTFLTIDYRCPWVATALVPGQENMVYPKLIQVPYIIAFSVQLTCQRQLNITASKQQQHQFRWHPIIFKNKGWSMAGGGNIRHRSNSVRTLNQIRQVSKKWNKILKKF